MLELLNAGPPQFHVLAGGDTLQERNNKKGHLFERFVALFLTEYGYSAPPKANVSWTENGGELDVVAQHSLDKSFAAVECKAYSTPLPQKDLQAFYGKLTTFRFERTGAKGFFIAIPNLTKDGEEAAREIVKHDPNFHSFNSERLVSELTRVGKLRVCPLSEGLYSDECVILTEFGVLQGIIELEAHTRLPLRMHVWAASSSTVPPGALDLIREAGFATGLEVQAVGEAAAHIPQQSTISVVAVRGSTNNFEYRLPASPEIFVGRLEDLKRYKALLVAAESLCQVTVFNGKSGWGKSSLALRCAALTTDKGGSAIVLDTRTAVSPDYVIHALRHCITEWEAAKMCKLTSDAAFGSLSSAVSSLSKAAWSGHTNLVVFDQFEGVFRDRALTQAFRDLTYYVKDANIPVILGYCWKTDFVALAETFPYQLREDIRSVASVFIMQPLDAKAIGTLITRLETEAGEKLVPGLRGRLREFSQGLPWLFKKLADHLLRQLQNGVKQDELLVSSLNIRELFESDLGGLAPAEREALEKLARRVPILASEAFDIVDPDIIQVLIDRRLIVQVGSALDTYWDIFRDYIITGEVPVLDSYILRRTPNEVSALLRSLISAGGQATVGDLSTAMKTSLGVVFNAARDLRQMGVLLDSPGLVSVAPQILEASAPEEAVRNAVQAALRRHKVYDLLRRLVGEQGTGVHISALTHALPEAFPAVQVTMNTWNAYTRAFLKWLIYARLISVRGSMVLIGEGEGDQGSLILQYGQRSRIRGTFPTSPAGPALRVLRAVAGIERPRFGGWSTAEKAMQDCIRLELVVSSELSGLQVAPNAILENGEVNKPLVLSQVLKQKGVRDVYRLWSEHNSRAQVLGDEYANAIGADWAPATRALAGKFLRSWFAALTPKKSVESDLFSSSGGS